MMKILVLWLRATGLTLEWTADDGRTFQITGLQGMAGYWERFFHAGTTPTRRNVGESEAEQVFGTGSPNFLLYRRLQDEAGAERVTRKQVLDRVEQMFPGATAAKRS